jgi:hypothetical protein
MAGDGNEWVRVPRVLPRECWLDSFKPDHGQGDNAYWQAYYQKWWDNMLAELAATTPEDGRSDAIKVEVLRIPRSENLDPITVYFEDHAPGAGRVTVACYGDAWTAWWGSMGNCTVREFIAGVVDTGYLSGALLQLRGASASHRNYTKRIAAAVIEYIAQAERQGES